MSQVEYGPLAVYYELINESCVPYDLQASFLEEALKRYGSPRDSVRALDIACGAGLLARRLVERGWHTTGIDTSLALVAQAVAEARTHLVQADMRHLPFAGCFDLACCLLHTVNYMVEDSDLLAVLRAAEAALVPGGLLVVDFIAYDPPGEWNAKWTEIFRGRGIKIVARHNQVADWARRVATDRHTYTVHEPTRQWSVSGVDTLRMTTAAELQEFAERADLECLHVSGKYAFGAPLSQDGGVLVARKAV